MLTRRVNPAGNVYATLRTRAQGGETQIVLHSNGAPGCVVPLEDRQVDHLEPAVVKGHTIPQSLFHADGQAHPIAVDLELGIGQPSVALLS